jgi:penicillin-binding protein 1A
MNMCRWQPGAGGRRVRREKTVRVYAKTRGFAQIDWDGLSWARKAAAGNENVGPMPEERGSDRGPRRCRLRGRRQRGPRAAGQVPEAQSALVALDPDDGGIAALVGGFDYFTNKYNRVTRRSACPARASSPSCIRRRWRTASRRPAPARCALRVGRQGIESSWRPENSQKEFGGPTRLRERWRNRATWSDPPAARVGHGLRDRLRDALRLRQAVLPQNLTLALGTMQVTPLEIASGYAVFANGGFKVSPYFVDRIEDAAGKVVYQRETEDRLRGASIAASERPEVDRNARRDPAERGHRARRPRPADRRNSWHRE